jgi:hypothetical protein
MADDAKPPSIDPALLEAARAKGVDVDVLIDRALRRELAERLPADEARDAANAVVADYNERFDRDGPWIEAWRHWE